MNFFLSSTPVVIENIESKTIYKSYFDLAEF